MNLMSGNKMRLIAICTKEMGDFRGDLSQSYKPVFTYKFQPSPAGDHLLLELTQSNIVNTTCTCWVLDLINDKLHNGRELDTPHNGRTHYDYHRKKHIRIPPRTYYTLAMPEDYDEPALSDVAKEVRRELPDLLRDL
jgi:hypothetical protein